MVSAYNLALMDDIHASSYSLRVADGTGERGSGSAAGTSSYKYNDHLPFRITSVIDYTERREVEANEVALGQTVAAVSESIKYALGRVLGESVISKDQMDRVATIVAGQLKEEASTELRAKAKVVKYEETAKAEKALSGGVNETVTKENAVKDMKDSELSIPAL